MPETSPLGIDVVTADGTVVGSTASPDQAVALACAVYGLSGLTLFIVQDDTTLAWLGQQTPAPTPPPAQMIVVAAVDSELPELWRFTLADAPGNFDVDYGDGTSEAFSRGTTSFAHSYLLDETYRVVVTSEGQIAETYVSVSPAPPEPAEATPPSEPN